MFVCLIQSAAGFLYRNTWLSLYFILKILATVDGLLAYYFCDRYCSFTSLFEKQKGDNSPNADIIVLHHVCNFSALIWKHVMRL